MNGCKSSAPRPMMFRHLLLALFFVTVFQAAADITNRESYIIINGGSQAGDYYYELKDNGGGNVRMDDNYNSPQQINLLSSPSLTIKGAELKTGATGGDYQNSNNWEKLYYRFYDQTETAPGYSDFNLTYIGENPYPENLWRTTFQNIGLIGSNDSGIYKLDAYTDGNGSYFSGGQQYFDHAQSSTFTGRYELFYGASTTATQASAFTGTGRFNMNGSGQTYTLNSANTYTGETQIDAGTVSITSSGSLSGSSMVYLGNGGNTLDAGLTLAGTTTFANNLQANVSSGAGTRTITKSDATSQTMSGSLTLNQLTSFDVVSGGSLTASGVVGGTNAFTKTGAGTMILSGSSANTFSAGTVTVSGGTLVLSKSANTAAIAGRPVIISAGATLRTDAAGQIGSAPLITATGTFDLNGNNQTVALGGAGVVKLDGSASSGTLTINNSGTDTFSGTITDNSRTDGAVTKTGAGTQILTGNNSYDGATTVSAGVLRIGHANGLGSTTGGTTISSGAALQLSNNVAVGVEALNLNSTGISNDGGLRNVHGNNSWAGTVTVTNGRIMSDTGTLTLGGAVSIGTGDNTLLLGGSGNITLNGAITGTNNANNGAIYFWGGANSVLTLAGDNTNTLTGLMRVRQGTISITNANSLTKGVLDLNSSGNQPVILLVNSNTTRAYETKFDQGSTSTNAAINVAAGVTFTHSGIISGNGNLTSAKFGKAGAGTLVLSSASSTYNGQIQIGEGILILAHSTGLGTNTTTAARGVDLGLNVGDVNMANNVSFLASNGVTVGQSFYVAANTNSALRTVGIHGNGSASYTNELYLDGTLTIDGGSATSDTVTMSGALVNTGGISKTNAGRLILSGNNSFTGATTVSNGVLRISHANALGGTGTGTTVVSGAALELSNNITTAAEGLSLTGSGVSNGGSLRNVSGNNTYAGAITLAGATTIASDAGTLTLDVAAGNAISGTQNLTFAGTGNITVNDAISISTGTFTKNGAGTANLNIAGGNTGSFAIFGGTVTLNPGEGNTFTAGNRFNVANTSGSVTVNLNSGIINLGGAGGISAIGDGVGATSGTMNVAGATVNVDLTTSRFLIGPKSAATVSVASGALNFTNNSNLYIGGDQQYNTTGGAAAGTLTISGTGAVSITGTGSLVLGYSTNSSGTINLDGGTLTTSRNITKGNLGTGMTASVNFNGGTLVVATNSTTFMSGLTAAKIKSGGAIIDTTNNNATIAQDLLEDSGSTGGGLTKRGSGILTLSGVNTYTGATTLNQGVLAIAASNNLGTGGVTINSNAALRATANLTNSRNITITTGNTGYVEAAAGTTNTLNGTLSKNGSVLVLGGGGTHIVNGSITGANANSDLVVSNSTTTINSTNSYNGPTFIVAAGTLNNGAANALPTDTALTLGQAGETSSTTNRYNLNGYSQTVASVATAGSSVNIVTNSTGSGNLTLNSSVDKSISGLTMGGTGLTLTKSGANTVTLASGNNIGPGTIAIQQGTLLLGAANQIGDSTAITLSGGKLSTAGYHDAVGKLTVTANSTIQGLNSTSGSAFTFSDIDLGNYSTSSGSTLTFLNSGGTTYSQGTVIQLSTVAASSWSGYSATSLNNFSSKISFSDANLMAQINFGGGTSGTTLTVAAIPEPKVYVAAGALALLIGYAEVRRRKKILSSKA